MSTVNSDPSRFARVWKVLKTAPEEVSLKVSRKLGQATRATHKFIGTDTFNANVIGASKKTKVLRTAGGYASTATGAGIGAFIGNQVANAKNLGTKAKVAVTAAGATAGAAIGNFGPKLIRALITRRAN